ncbi:MAG: PEGA domain-containing protein [Myxococcota bacterium]
MKLLATAVSCSLCMLLAVEAAAANDGLSVAIVSVGLDSPSAGEAVLVGRTARQALGRNPRYDLLPLEDLLSSEDAVETKRRRQEAEGSLRRARAAFDALELEPALESSAEAQLAFEQALDSDDSVKGLLESLLLQGSAFALSGESQQAQQAFRRACVLDERVNLDGFSVPAEVERTFDAACAKVANGPRGTLAVYATPPAAEVWVDGRFRGTSPLRIEDMVDGRHYVRVLRDGYRPFVQAVDVARRREATVQATLRPTERFAEFDDLQREARDASPTGLADLAAMLRVDVLLSFSTEAAGDSVRVRATLTDGVSGERMHDAHKTFTSSTPRYRSDLELWIQGAFREGLAQRRSAEAREPVDEGRGRGAFLPPPRQEVPMSVKTKAGWWLLGASALPLALGVGFGIGSLVPWDAYKNEGKLFRQPTLSSQLDDDRDEVYNSFLVTSLIADVSYALAAVLGGIGGTLLWLGTEEEEQLEDVLSGTRPPGSEMRLTRVGVAHGTP